MLKKSYIIAIFLFCFSLTYSQNRIGSGGNVTIFSDRDPFYLFINGIQYNDQPSKQVRVEQLKDHLYDLQVEFVGRVKSSLSKKGVSVLNEDGEFLDLTYLANSIRSNRMRSLTLYAMFPADNHLPDPRDAQVFAYGRPKQIVDSESEYEYGHETYYGDEMTVSEFNAFLKTIDQGGFDNDKLKIASMSTSQVSFSLNQIKDVLKRFSWDEGKLAFAKMAYANCPEKRNYMLLTDQFSFGDSKNKLLDFIKNQPIDSEYLERMSEVELNSLIKMMSQSGFDEDKLKILATVSEKVAFPVASIKRILKELSWDQGKLSAAQKLYPNCLDKRNYAILLDEFTFLDYKNKFTAFVRNQK
ncbi:DUF4476 domain-containing protein [Sphingobacterium sp. PCS056]|uniref:DUF4476 domain-containing protein n=1 Tax=Sphingobacterium sp. PCS056 TaxID=2931400 RepID=UPI0020101680|nr:DUF4476 domain-containing protein [Sphingobacterium sp. PCS056]UPZ35146.1 DUF4476 domain-containing protein [Sphingobacterium sp. PCS056]